jgi:hypothetical protein
LIEAQTGAGDGGDVPRALARFLAQDRKPILFHGYSDGGINPFCTIEL